MNGLDSYGRVTIDGTEWVLYSDGAYRHVVQAEDYDRYDEDGINEEKLSDHYTDWCWTARFADDATAIEVARQLDCETVHSGDGTCSVLAVDED